MDESTSVQVIPYYAHPHVHTVIFDHTWYEETVATPVDPTDKPFAVAVVAAADSGIDNTFVRLSDLDTKIALFGRGNFQKYGQASLQTDMLFNGNTNVWFCRVLPDNAQYANMILLAHYRKGSERDDLDQEIGTKRMEIKFSVVYADKTNLTEGATDDDAIYELAKSYETSVPDARTGYYTVPVCYVRSIGRGKYGNRYSIVLRRDAEAEKEYTAKMYKWGLMTNSDIASRCTNVFSGALYQTAKNNVSLLISDVLDQYATGSCPIYVYPFEDCFEKIYTFYEGIVAENYNYLSQADATQEQLNDLEYAQNITRKIFDPLFGYKLKTRRNELIPYYKNYTVKATGPYTAPDLEVANEARIPRNIANWNTVQVGSTILVQADGTQGGFRWRYTVTEVNENNGNITYDAGYEAFIDDAEYDGVDITLRAGIRLTGGHDGDFQEITVDGETREPTAAEMKLLLSREYVKAWHGEKDRKILSPARMDFDFIFDANYNLTSSGDLELDDTIQAMYSNSTVLTDEDYEELTILNRSGTLLDLTDINVKAAMYDLNEFRNKNGMTIANREEDYGAGCLLHLDCGIVAYEKENASTDIADIIHLFEGFLGRATSIDLGYYTIYDPYTTRKITVTATYFLAEKLIPHLMRYGLNKPFTYNYARLSSITRTGRTVPMNTMIRDTFRPNIDLIDWDVKEELYLSRLNYYITREEGRIVERAVQNTRQMDASALLEESNVRVLNALKKGLEKACRQYLYEWNEPEARKSYTDAQMEKYRPWIGTMVQDIDIHFEANEWEQERMIMHCYCAVAFRDIVKRIILEINVNRPNY